MSWPRLFSFTRRPPPVLLPGPASETLTSSFLLGNLHCVTCVSAIKEALQDSCAGHVKWVSPNVVTSVVTVEHDAVASISDMQDALEGAGFEVCRLTTSTVPGRLADTRGQIRLSGSGMERQKNQELGPMSAIATLFRRASPRAKPADVESRQAKAHLDNCTECRLAETASVRNKLDVSLQSSLVIRQPEPQEPRKSAANQIQREGMLSKPSFVVGVEGSHSLAPHFWRAILVIRGMTRAACVERITDCFTGKDGILNVVVDLVSNTAIIDVVDKNRTNDLAEMIKDLGCEAKLENVIEIGSQSNVADESDTWRATIVVGGMTCASCSNIITQNLTALDWIRGVSVNLLTHSASVEFEGKDNAHKLVDMIEDMGYDASLDNVTALNREKNKARERTVEVRINGLYCEHCSSRVACSLAGFRRQLDILSQPIREHPIMRLTYVPDAPNFTIRHILAAIEASDQAFKASIHHPQTLEEKLKAVQKKHQREMLSRAIVTGAVSVPTFIIGIVYMSLVPKSNSIRMLLMHPWTSGISRAQIAMMIMATPVYLYGASNFHVRAFKEMRNLWRPGSRVPFLQRFYRFGSMNTLMSLGTTIAFLSSVGEMIDAAVRRREMVDDTNFYFDSVVFLTLFLLTGRLIESFTKSKTGDAVELLGELRPTTAMLVQGYGSDEEVNEVVQADLLDFGDVIRIPYGASPPADGTVVRGESKFDESSLTGESRLVKKGPGDEVFSGTVNRDGAVFAQISGIAGRSMLDRIVSVVREGQTRRAPVEQIADLLTTYFVPVVTLIAILTWVIWMSLGLSGRLPPDYLPDSSSHWVPFSLQFAIAVFVVACPCGLALAAPTAIFIGGALAAKNGILAKSGGEAFEKASRIDCVVFDKTGTLTQGGEPSITDSEVYPDKGMTTEERRAEVLAALKAVEENSSHPIAKAIVTFCSARCTSRVHVLELQEMPGKGMKAAYQSGDPETAHEVIIGNEGLMQDFSIVITPKVSNLVEKWKNEAKSIALAAVRTPATDGKEASDWTLAAALSISDPIRPEAAPVVRALQSRGTRVWMLSGDNPTTAAAVAAKIGIPAGQVIAGVLPTEKAAKIKYLQSTIKARVGVSGKHATRRATIAMVGDGINDSPALATADVGVAIGSGSDVAISSADFILLTSNLTGVLTLLDLSRVVFRRIKFNFCWALIYNLVAVPVAAGAFYAFKTHGGAHLRLDPVWASLAMALSSISVVMSSLALRSRLPIIGFRQKRGLEG